MGLAHARQARRALTAIALGRGSAYGRGGDRTCGSKSVRALSASSGVLAEAPASAPCCKTTACPDRGAPPSRALRRSPRCVDRTPWLADATCCFAWLKARLTAVASAALVTWGATSGTTCDDDQSYTPCWMACS